MQDKVVVAPVEFQFPSNGKAYPKPSDSICGEKRWVSVSIPFKRESLSKGRRTSTSRNEVLVSIPFKRESLSKDDSENAVFRQKLLFQFPSNGKAYPKSL